MRGRIRLLRLRSGLRRFASLLLHLPRIILTQSPNCLPAYRVEVFDIDAISGDIALKIGSPSDTRQDPPPGANGGGGVQLPPSAVSAVPLFLKKNKSYFLKKEKKNLSCKMSYSRLSLDRLRRTVGVFHCCQHRRPKVSKC